MKENFFLKNIIKHYPLRLAAFMSGTGTNIRRLLEYKSPHYKIIFIFSDRNDNHCNGQQIAHEYGLPFFSYDIRKFYKLKGVKRKILNKKDYKIRKEYDKVAYNLVKSFNIDLIILAGYMSILTLKNAINVHPADLSILNNNKQRRYIGEYAVIDAILDGANELRSSTLWINEGTDSGPLLMVSNPLSVRLPISLDKLRSNPTLLNKVAYDYQTLLKIHGDWVILPLTIELIATRRLLVNNQGISVLDGKLYPQGVRLANL